MDFIFSSLCNKWSIIPGIWPILTQLHCRFHSPPLNWLRHFHQFLSQSHQSFYHCMGVGVKCPIFVRWRVTKFPTFFSHSGLSLCSTNDRFKCIHILKIDRFNDYSLSNLTFHCAFSKNWQVQWNLLNLY